MPFLFCVALGTPAAGKPPLSDPAVVARVVAEPVREEVLQTSTTGFGKVESQPAKVISLDAPHAGTVSKVSVRPGQIVDQGSQVAELAASASTEEAFRKAQTARDFARAKLDRLQFLWKRGATTKDPLDLAEIAFKNAQASLDAQKRIGAQDQQTSIEAPISGVVTAVFAAEGDHVLQNAKLLSLTPANALAVLLGVEPEDIRKVKTGMPVALAPAFDAQRKYSGRVIAVNDVIDPKTRLVNVMVEIDPSGLPAPLIGTEMEGRIETRRDRSLVIPRAAVLYDKHGAYLFTVNGGRAHRVSVTPGMDGGGNIAVSGDVKVGDLVVVQGNYELQDGMKVEQVPHAVK